MRCSSIENPEQSQSQLDSQQYQVSQILDRRIDPPTGEVQYCVSWQGYSQRTWEPVQSFKTCPWFIQEYEQHVKKTGKTSYRPKYNKNEDEDYRPYKSKFQKISRTKRTLSKKVKKQIETVIKKQVRQEQMIQKKEGNDRWDMLIRQFYPYLPKNQQEIDPIPTKAKKKRFKIKLHLINNGELEFLVQNRQQSWIVTRDQMMEKHPRKLALYFEKIIKLKQW